MFASRRRTLIVMVVVALVALLGWQSFAAAQAKKKQAAQNQAGGQKKPGAQGQPGAQKQQPGAGAQGAKADEAHPVATAVDAKPTGPWLSSGDSYDDFCSVAQASDGTLFAAYAAYYDGHDQIRLHKQLPSGRWSTRVYVPLVETEPDIWMPQLAVDASDRLWVIWSEQTGRSARSTGNWDLYARALDRENWGPAIRLTEHAGPDINHHVHTDAKGGIHVVWQGHGDNTGDIMLCRFDGQNWSKPLAVTSGPESDWYPQVSVDRNGVEWIAFDSYRNGDYDIFVTSVRGNEVGPLVPVATSLYYEAHPTITCTPDDQVWIAWEQAGWLWGKDQGHWLQYEKRNVGTVLGSPRSVKVAVLRNGKLLAGPALPEPEAPAEGNNVLRQNVLGNPTSMPKLATDRDGRVWLAFRRQRRGGVPNNRGQFKRFWTEQVTWLKPDGWAQDQEMQLSPGRISVFTRLTALKNGGMAVAYSADARGPADYHQPIQDRTFVTQVAAPTDPVGTPELVDYAPPEPPANAVKYDFDTERKYLDAIRSHRRTIGGVEHRIARGDLHRHTELSWDVGPGNDGSYLDFYRYMIDVAGMDFGSLTDHQGGGHYAYHWWLTQKSADMYYLPPRFVPLYGYERSVKFPDGHRNIFHAQRGVPIFAFQTKLNLTSVFPGVASGDVVENDTKLLYEFLHKTGGIAISHTSATDTMGTDWRDNDPRVEPVVEIYQGARNSSEVVGGPRVHPIDKEPREKAPGGYQEAGMMWNAWGKGYRLGITSSSDHGSTHISYSLVYTPKLDRQALIDAMKQRQTYGATDNLIVAFEADGHFMGQEFSSEKPPTLKLSVRGTGTVKRVDLIRNAQYVYASSPNKADVEINYTDMQPDQGLNYYYFRLEQEDGEIAWASPVWINYAK